MSNEFTERAVAFLDILGFKKLIDEAEASPAGFQRLLGLKTVLESHVKFDNAALDSKIPAEMYPKYLFVSDSIIFSAPLKLGAYDGLNVVVLKSVQLAQKILELGHLVRGGISVGSVWHEQANIFGSGYIDAFKTEQAAVHPQVLLSERAAAEWTKPNREVPELCLSLGGKIVVDVLNVAYLRGNLVGLPMETYFDHLRVTIDKSLHELPLGSDARSKWEWMAGFFNNALQRHGLNVPPFASLPLPNF